jgi:hypothetical protein
VSLQIVAGVAAVALAVFGVLLGLAMYFARKSERERIHRWLAERSVEVMEDVEEIIGEPLGSDAELLSDIRANRMSDSD